VLSNLALISQISHPDSLADMIEFESDPDFHRNLWTVFKQPSLKETLGEQNAEYDTKIERCRHLSDLRKEAEEEFRKLQAKGRLNTNTVQSSDTEPVCAKKEDSEAIRKRCAKKIDDAVRDILARRTLRMAQAVENDG
jgi:hypothetical protein